VFCDTYSLELPYDLSLLFTDIIESTGRAAAALHSHTALLSSTAYDKLIKVFNRTEEVHMAVSTTVRTPGLCSDYRCSGFIAVTTLLGVHLAIVAAITTLYVSQVRYSRCSSTWHAVSQLISDELEDTLNQGNNSRDRFITKALKRDGKNNLVKLGLTDDGTRVQVFKHTDDKQRPVDDEGSSSSVGEKIKLGVKRWFGKKKIRAK
jgi:hypothetical protein